MMWKAGVVKGWRVKGRLVWLVVLAMKAGLAVAAGGDTVATVNGVAVPRADLEQLVRASGQADTAALRQTLTQGLVARELIRQAAQREHLEDTAVVREAQRRARVDTENRLYVARHAVVQPVGEAQVRARYDAIAGEMGDEEYLAGVLSFREEAAARAAALRLERDGPFAAVGGGTAGLQWVSFRTPPVEGHTAGLPLEVARVVPAALLGMPQVVAGGAGGEWRVVLVQARRPVVMPPYAQVAAALRAGLEAQAREEAFRVLLDGLAAKAVVVKGGQP
ncbi:SurA N-terminal domain-containing protein [Paraburkholderia kururiensis]|uniref:peptidyl-prolyl cis-trans isomerase n=1 Tax=Paraburkholderia kururiensis TaxID=984307 RepID=UPI0039A4196C